MAELKLPSGLCSVKLGKTLTSKNKSAASYHTLRYDFRPASVESSEKQFLQIGSNNEVTVTVPKMRPDGQIADAVVFRGSKKPYAKECLLIIDHDTGDITLENLASNIQVKKTRGENLKRLNELLSAYSAAQTEVAASAKPVPCKKRRYSSLGKSTSSSSDESDNELVAVEPPKKISPESSSSDEETIRSKPVVDEKPQPIAKETVPQKRPSASGHKSVLHSDLQLSDSDSDDEDD